jgi:hypothetical protein
MKALSGQIRPAGQYFSFIFLCHLKKNGCPQLLTEIQRLPSTQNRTHPGVSVSNASTYVTLAFVHWEEFVEVRVPTDKCQLSAQIH